MNKIILTTPEELLDYIRQVLRQELANQPNFSDQSDYNDPIGIDEASVFTKIPKNTIYQLTMKRLIPHGRNGKRLIFFRPQLLAWLKEKNKPIQEEIEAGNFSTKSSTKKGGAKW